MKLYHGGVRGLRVGDPVIVAQPHVTDGCPICVARVAGRTFTVRDMRAWMLTRWDDPNARAILKSLEGQPPGMAVDGPTPAGSGVFVTSDVEYARFYAARSMGDLYRVEAVGLMKRSTSDHFESFECEGADVIEVLARDVVRTRKQRRELERRWKKADLAHESLGAPFGLVGGPL